MRILALILFSAACVFSQTPPIEPGVSQELAKWRAAHYSDVRYNLNLTLEKMSPVLKGTLEIRVTVSGGEGGNRSGGAATQQSSPPYEGGVDAALGGRGGSLIILDWRKIKGYEDRSRISNVSINGKHLFSSTRFDPTDPDHDPDERDFSEPVIEQPEYTWNNEHLVFNFGVVVGENVIKLDFTSPILTSGSAITRYVDKEDGSEYIYSLFVPSDASTAFPVFDQPDLKASFSLQIQSPEDWRVISNAVSDIPIGEDDSFIRLQDWEICGPEGKCPTGYKRPQLRLITSFFETKPISTYVFAFAAGPFERVAEPPALAGGTMPDGNPAFGKSDISPPANAGGSASGKSRTVRPEIKEVYKNWANTARDTDKTADPATSIYVRKSQAEKFKPHAAEVFRLNREAIKYFEEYFDYKFPFPKYDLVLIPEFPFGGMEHAGATFLREASIIFPQEPTKNDHISRAVLIFHEAAHQWFGDTVTMRWFDDLWLKEGFANFAAYKAMERIMPEANAWKVFYERVKQAAYQTDSTKGTTPIYQEIPNLSAAKSAYGNIVYNKAPAFLRQAEFYLGEDKFQTAVRAFLKKHEFKNAGWEDLVKELEAASKQDLKDWANTWVKKRGVPLIRTSVEQESVRMTDRISIALKQSDQLSEGSYWKQKFNVVSFGNMGDGKEKFYLHNTEFDPAEKSNEPKRQYPMEARINWSTTIHFGAVQSPPMHRFPRHIFPNHKDFGYGIFLLDIESRKYFLRNLGKVDDPFARSMIWGSLWDSVREGELDPKQYVDLVIQNLLTTPEMQKPARSKGESEPSGESDESTIATLLNRTSTALNYYLTESQRTKYAPIVEEMILQRLQTAETNGQAITYYRAFVSIASSEKGRAELKGLLSTGRIESRNNHTNKNVGVVLRTKDKFDIVTRLLILNDPDAPKLFAELEKKETTDEAKRYAYAARAGIPTAENKAKYWNDFVNNKEISESWIEAAFGPSNSIRHNELTLPYLQKALQELPNHKRSRKIFFVNGWLGAFIGGQRSEEALAIVNRFLADNPNLDKDLRLKILENVDVIERAVKIRAKFKN